MTQLRKNISILSSLAWLALSACNQGGDQDFKTKSDTAVMPVEVPATASQASGSSTVPAHTPASAGVLNRYLGKTNRSEQGISDAPTALFDRTWRIDTIGKERNTNLAGPTLAFSDTGTVTGNAGCNGYMATYRLSGSRFDLLRLTKSNKLCGSAIMEVEEVFLAALGSADTLAIDDNGRLVLRSTSFGSITAR